jgi:UDP-N-acetylmuramoylalanine--D-glutamate ligase
MIALPAWKGKCLGICGLGKTGHAAVKALRAAGAELFIWDDGERAREGENCTPPSQWPWAELDAVLVSPGVPLTFPKPHEAVLLAQQHGVRITSDVELFAEAVGAAWLCAITGTNGKSTTTALTGHILQQAGRKAQVGGNIGTPVLALEPGADIYVLELSSYQLDLLPPKLRFHTAALLNFSPDHIDRHGDMAGYVAAKKKLFSGQTMEDVAVVGVDDEYSAALAQELVKRSVQQVVPVSVQARAQAGVSVQDAVLYEQGNEVLSLQDCVNLQGTHNHQNAAVAFALCRSLGLDAKQIFQGFETYPGLAHRMQRVAEKKGVLYVNDSKATNADAAARSLATYERIHWIAGGVAKAGGIESLEVYFPKVVKAYLIGQAEEAFAQTLEGKAEVLRCGTLEEAVKQARKNAKKGEVVLLAPACASFDQFASFEMRGDMFAALVKAL